MKTVWRFKLDREPVQIVKLPKSAKIDVVYDYALFAIVDTDAPLVEHTIALVRIGCEIPPAKKTDLLGTVLRLSGHYAVLLLTQPDPAGLVAFKATVAAAKAKAKLKAPIPAPPADEDGEGDEEDPDEDE